MKDFFRSIVRLIRANEMYRSGQYIKMFDWLLVVYRSEANMSCTMRSRTSLNKRHRKPKAQSRMDNSDTSNGYTTHRTKTKKKQSKKKQKNNTTQTTVRWTTQFPTKNWGEIGRSRNYLRLYKNEDNVRKIEAKSSDSHGKSMESWVETVWMFFPFSLWIR
jgi:hypothetical protein